MTLSSSGRTNFQNASASLKEKQKYQYTITFKFTDNASGKEGKCNVSINLFKAKLITVTDIENMMKSIKCNDGLSSPSAGQIIFSYGDITSGGGNLGFERMVFDFNNASYGYDGLDGFELTCKTENMIKDSVKTYTASNKIGDITSAIKNTEQYKEWFGWSFYGIDCSVEVKPAQKSSFGYEVASKATFTLKFTNSLRSGYAFTNMLTYNLGKVMTNKGLKIILNADKKPSDTKGSEWK